MVHGVLLRPLPYPNADRLVTILERKVPEGSSGPSIEALSLSEPQLADLRSHTKSLVRVGSYADASLMLTGPQESARLEAQRVSADSSRCSAFRRCSAVPFSPSDEMAGAEDVAVLSYAAWQRYVGGAGDILGRRSRSTAAMSRSSA